MNLFREFAALLLHSHGVLSLSDSGFAKAGAKVDKIIEN